MFTLLARVLQKLSRAPRAVLLCSLVCSLLCIFPVRNLRWELQLADMLPQKNSSDAFEKYRPGNLFPLSVVIEGEDSLKNLKIAEAISKKLEKNPLVRFSAFQIDVEFFEKNQLLYLPLRDLNTIYERLSEAKIEYFKKLNPLLIEVDGKNEYDIYSIERIEQKYETKFRDVFTNQTGTVRILDVFPNVDTEQLDSARLMLSAVKTASEAVLDSFNRGKNLAGFQRDSAGVTKETTASVSKENLADSPTKNSAVKIGYAGKIPHIVSTGKTLLPEAKKAGIYMAILIAIVLLALAIRQPLLIVPAGLPIALSIFWTLGIAGVLFGRICLFSLLLALILPGLAAQHVTHFLHRYLEESRKGLGASLCLESALLGIGPSAAASAAAASALFLSLTLIPYAGLFELGILGAIGTLLNWILCNLLMPSILWLFQRKKSFFLLGKLHPEKLKIENVRPFRQTKICFALLLALSAILSIRGVYPKFHYRFSDTELSTKTHADSIVSELGHDFNDPLAIKFSTPKEAENFVSNFRTEKSKKNLSTIKKIYTPGNLLPANQAHKLQIIKDIREFIQKEPFPSLTGKNRERIEFLNNHTNLKPIFPEDLPRAIRPFYSGHLDEQNLVIVIPSAPASDGSMCRRLIKEIKKLAGENSFKASGEALIYAEMLDNILSHTFKAILFAIAMIFLILLLHYNKFSYTLFTLFPPCVAFFWLLSSLRLFNIELSVYSALAFPILISMSLDGALHFWNHYFQKQGGSAFRIVQRHAQSIALAQIMTAIGMTLLFFSSHPGLKSIGQISLLGLLCITLADFFIFPLSAAMLDLYRLKKNQR